ALSIECSNDILLPKTADQICTLIECAFAMGDIKADLFCSIALLNSFSDNFPHACCIISCNIPNSTHKSLYTSNNIHHFLENKQTLLENDQCTENKSYIALAAHTKPQKTSNSLICSNPVCKKTGHTIEFFIKSGGGMASDDTQPGNPNKTY
ncbi:hypothetical protein L208DRAFT_1473729, partial [Tricholoma matsutake]